MSNRPGVFILGLVFEIRFQKFHSLKLRSLGLFLALYQRRRGKADW